MSHSPVPNAIWQRRVVAPVLQQLRQGITMEKVALTLALGFAISIFPIFGTTTILCGIAAAVFRLNQPLIQIVNCLAYPVQLALLIPFFRTGEWLLGRRPVPLNASLLVERFHADAGRFFRDFGMIAAGGMLVWVIVAPIVVGVGYGLLRVALRGLMGRTQVGAVSTASP